MITLDDGTRSIVFLKEIVDDPADYYRSFKRITASVANAVVWGHRGPIYDSFWGRVSARSIG